LPTPAHPHEGHSIESDILDQDMTADDIVFMLENLRFSQDGLGRLRIDRGVRTYLRDALRARTHRP
jgi:hypothetical protein